MNHKLQIVHVYEYICTVASNMSFDEDCTEFGDIEALTQAADVLYQAMGKSRRAFVNPPKKKSNRV